MTQPLVTVNILSYNRKDDLRVTLTKVYEQDYKNIEVIVVDNNSTDGTREIVKKEFPEVRLIELDRNIGIAGWNEGFKVAKGEYVLVLDDDSYPEKKTINLCVETIIKDDLFGIIACEIFNSSSNKISSYLKINDIPLEFIGCGALIRKTVIDEVGMFSNVLFIYLHELEFSLRVIDAGYIIVEKSGARIIHNLSVKNRELNNKKSVDFRKIYYDARNINFILLKYFGVKNVWFKLARISLGRLYIGIKFGCFFKVMSAILSGIMLAIRESRHRAILRYATQEKYQFGRFGGGFFFKYSSYANPRPSWLARNHFRIDS